MTIRELLKSYQNFNTIIYLNFKGLDDRYVVYEFNLEKKDSKLYNLIINEYHETLLSETRVKLNIDLVEKENDYDLWAKLLETYYLYIDDLKRLNGEKVYDIESDDFDL